MVTAPLLEIDRLSIAYPQINPSPGQSQAWAVQDVSLTLQPGDRLGLVGESGSGKSTLGRAILRLLPDGSQVTGGLRFQGQSIPELSPKALRQFRGEAVGLVFQDPMTRLDPLMTIGDHCLETLQAHEPGLSRQEARSRVLETLEAVRIPPNRWQQYPHEFSGGMRQRVAIALALLLNPRLLIADEPTTSLDVTVAAEILQELVRLCSERGMALLLISHDLALVSHHCPHLAVMCQGNLMEQGDTQTVLAQPQNRYTQTLIRSALLLHQGRNDSGSNSTHAANLPQDDQRPALLTLKQAQQHYSLGGQGLGAVLGKGRQRWIKAVDNINLTLFQGETLGLVGESGCGKSTLCRTILHLIRPTGGSFHWSHREGNQDLGRLSRRDWQRHRRHMQMIFQDPHACLNPQMTIGQSIGDPLKIHRLAQGAAVKAQVCQMLERVGLTPVEEFYDRYPHQLSGGQQQRVAIARALITRPQLLICDEPVSMLDATVQTQVLELMLDLKREFQLTYLFVTHDLGVARFFCDRLAVMTGGQIVELGETEQIFSNPQHPYTQGLLKAAPSLPHLNWH